MEDHKLKRIILLIAFLLAFSIHATAESAHELWDIPYGETSDATLGKMNEHGVVFNDIPLSADKAYKVLITPDDFRYTFMGEAIDSISLEFEFDDVKASWIYSSTKIFTKEIPLNDQPDSFLDQVRALYMSMSSEFGNPTDIYAALVDENLESRAVYYNDIGDMLDPENYTTWLKIYPIIGIRVYFGNVVLEGIIDNYDPAYAHTQCELYYGTPGSVDMIQGYDVG